MELLSSIYTNAPRYNIMQKKHERTILHTIKSKDQAFRRGYYSVIRTHNFPVPYSTLPYITCSL